MAWNEVENKPEEITLVFLQWFSRVVEFAYFKWKLGSNKFWGCILGLFAPQIQGGIFYLDEIKLKWEEPSSFQHLKEIQFASNSAK